MMPMSRLSPASAASAAKAAAGMKTLTRKIKLNGFCHVCYHVCCLSCSESMLPVLDNSKSTGRETYDPDSCAIRVSYTFRIEYSTPTTMAGTRTSGSTKKNS